LLQTKKEQHKDKQDNEDSLGTISRSLKGLKNTLNGVRTQHKDKQDNEDKTEDNAQNKKKSSKKNPTKKDP
jgi:hypothetical protein